MIVSDAGSSLREFEVWKTPPGFIETVPLTVIIQEEPYVAEVTGASPWLRLRTGFEPSSLQPSVWEISGDESLTEAQFVALRPCD